MSEPLPKLFIPCVRIACIMQYKILQCLANHSFFFLCMLPLSDTECLGGEVEKTEDTWSEGHPIVPGEGGATHNGAAGAGWPWAELLAASSQTPSMGGASQISPGSPLRSSPGDPAWTIGG